MNWSMQLYSARNFQPWDRVLRTLAQAGYSEVEGYGDLYADPAALRAELDRNDLTMPSGHFDIAMLEKDFDGARRIADAVGIETLVCPYVGEADRPRPTPDGWRGFGERLAKVGERARQGGYAFAWHNHDFEFAPLADGSIPMDHLLETAPGIGWEMDVAWIVRGGADPLAWADRYGKRIVAIHVKDIAAQGEGDNEDGWADVGYGTIDWKSLLPALRARTTARHFVMEHDNPNDFGRFAARSIASVNGY